MAPSTTPSQTATDAAAAAVAVTSQAMSQAMAQPAAQAAAAFATQPITPELQRWIVEQAELGCRPADVLQAMVAAGWQQDVAVAAMEHTLRRRLAELDQHAGRPPLQVQALAQEVAGVLPDPVVVPEPALHNAPPTLHAGGRDVRIVATLQLPRVVVFGGLLSDDECEALMALARPRLARSETVHNDTGGSEVNQARTSDGMFFTRGETPLIARIEERIGELLSWPVAHGEGLQILRYRPGAEYRPHHDYFDPKHPGTASILQRGGQRVATLVMYLNTPKAGGATTFPDVGLHVAPARGNAVYFSYDRAHPMTRTLHGGAPVIEGEKWVATKWLRQGVFV